MRPGGSRALSFLAQAGRHGRVLLVAGLLAGIALPSLAARMAPFLPVLIASLLFLAVLRIGPARMVGTFGDAKRTLRDVLILQLVVPLCVCALLAGFGLLGTVPGMAVALLFAAAPLAGSPNLTLMVGFDPDHAVRLVILGTALIPLTAIPVFWALPGLTGGAEVLGSALRLLVVIGLAAIAAVLFRRHVLPDPDRSTLDAIDGLSAIAMAVVVVALMSAIGPALSAAPGALAAWMALAFAANLGAQGLAAMTLRLRGAGVTLVPTSIVAGNRNVALFLVSLPPEQAAQLLTFIGCYQVPMYLTPLLMPRFYRRIAGPEGRAP